MELCGIKLMSFLSGKFSNFDGSNNQVSVELDVTSFSQISWGGVNWCSDGEMLEIDIRLVLRNSGTRISIIFELHYNRV